MQKLNVNTLKEVSGRNSVALSLVKIVAKTFFKNFINVQIGDLNKDKFASKTAHSIIKKSILEITFGAATDAVYYVYNNLFW